MTGFITVVGLSLAWAVISWLLVNWWALIVLGALAALGGTVWVHRYRQQQAWDRVRQQGLRYGLPQLDALHHRDFEYAIRDLMRRDGCTDARQIGGLTTAPTSWPPTHSAAPGSSK